jgi:hypothetical protein
MKEKHELNEGHIHEAIDRIHVATVYLQNSFVEHALIDSVNEFRVEIEKTIETLSDLYQKIGSFESIAELSQKHKLHKGYKISK